MTNTERIYGVTPLERLLAHSEELPNGCIVWKGAKNKQGYARFKVNGQNVAVHRFAYESLVGPIPEGLVLDHLCRNPVCINVKHLEPVPQYLNVMRGFGIGVQNLMKTHCPKGHPHRGPSIRGGARICPECRKEMDHIRRGFLGGHNRYKTHCKRGHEFTPENTLIVRDGRCCKMCNRLRARAKYAEGRPDYRPLPALRKDC